MTTARSTATSTVGRGHPSPGTTLVQLTRQSWAGLRLVLGFTVLLGIVYPLAVTGVGQLALPWQANGSLLTADGSHVTDADDPDVVGSALVGQRFDGPEWFHPRPSAAGEGYDTLASAGSNLGPSSHELLAAVLERRAAVAAEEGIDPSAVPPDALTASASGLDPDISPEYARAQVERVAGARGIPAADVAALVESATLGRTAGVLGEPRVNVLRLNLAVSTMGT